MEYIRNFLKQIEPLVPAPTNLMPSIPGHHMLKAFVFDVYGTLLISASGDIDQAEISAENLKKALEISNIRMTGSIKNHRRILTAMLKEFVGEIKNFHQHHRTLDRPYPEIDIQHIWKSIVTNNHKNGNLQLDGELCIKCLTFVFEILSNRLYPMPGMKEVIIELAGKGIPLGIVSNAQFYTPVVLNYFLSGRISEEEQVDFFDPDLTVFSYKYQRSKPDLFLFQALVTVLQQKYKIQPHEVLVVGNDMQKDVYAGQITGFRTALFAGDQRSLRLRQEVDTVRDIKPDYIITDLGQLLTLVD
jgi:putative hydrolase of the HAD superfamily